MRKISFFTKVTTDENHELFKWATEKPIRWAVLMVISSRVASKDQVTTGLAKGEFFISETEYNKFGLSLSERGKLRRTILELVDVKIIEKIENKIGNKNCTVYRFLDSDFIDCSRENREQNREQIENRQRTDREQIETNKECKNDKNERKDIIEDNEKNIEIVDKPPTHKDFSFDHLEKSIEDKDEMYLYLVDKFALQRPDIGKAGARKELQKFCDFYGATSYGSKKRHWQKQKTFSVPLRLRTWFENVRVTKEYQEELEREKTKRMTEYYSNLSNNKQNG